MELNFRNKNWYNGIDISEFFTKNSKKISNSLKISVIITLLNHLFFYNTQVKTFSNAIEAASGPEIWNALGVLGLFPVFLCLLFWNRPLIYDFLSNITSSVLKLSFFCALFPVGIITGKIIISFFYIKSWSDLGMVILTLILFSLLIFVIMFICYLAHIIKLKKFEDNSIIYFLNNTPGIVRIAPAIIMLVFMYKSLYG